MTVKMKASIYFLEKQRYFDGNDSRTFFNRMEARVGRAFQRSGRLCQHPMFSRSLEINTKEESRRFSIRLLGEPNNLRDCFDFCLLYHLGVFEFPSETYFTKWRVGRLAIMNFMPDMYSWHQTSTFFKLSFPTGSCFKRLLLAKVGSE